MISEVREHLINKIIPFWESLRDDVNGGYYGYVGQDLKIDKEAYKGCILNNRITWFFSSTAKLFIDERAGLVKCVGTPVSQEYIDELADHADHGYEFLKRACLDPEYGGMYWSVSCDGKPEDTTKHTYNQAFSIYALSSYYDLTRKEEALNIALQIYRIIEEKCRDEGGYLEAFDREFAPSCNDKLSENGIIATRTMNTLLHVFEAYTELLRVLSGIETGDVFKGLIRPGSGDVEKKELAAEIKEKLDAILLLFADKMYNPAKHRQEVFFDHEYVPLLDLISYGHDIETAWLMDRGCDVLRLAEKKEGSAASGNTKLPERIDSISRDLTDNIFRNAFDGHSMPEECEAGVVKTSRTWWMQAETVVGFVNGYQHDTSKPEYLDAAHSMWKYICEYVIDPREGSEWFHDFYEDGTPIEEMPIVEEWKCPYHNGRMCIELIRRGVE